MALTGQLQGNSTAERTPALWIKASLSPSVGLCSPSVCRLCNSAWQNLFCHIPWIKPWPQHTWQIAQSTDLGQWPVQPLLLTCLTTLWLAHQFRLSPHSSSPWLSPRILYSGPGQTSFSSSHPRCCLLSLPLGADAVRWTGSSVARPPGSLCSLGAELERKDFGSCVRKFDRPDATKAPDITSLMTLKTDLWSSGLVNRHASSHSVAHGTDQVPCQVLEIEVK